MKESMESRSWRYNTILFLASQNVSLFGSLLVQYAIMWHITLTTQSGAMMTISIICGFVPTLIISPFAGVWADRFDRKRLIVISDALIASATLGMAMLFYYGHDAIWQLFAVLAIRSFGNGVQTPAIQALLPQIVPQEKLMRVNGINNSTLSFVNIISPIASGALLSLVPIESIFFIDVGTAMIAIFILSILLKIPSRVLLPSTEKVHYLTDLSDGIRYIRNHKFINKLFLFCGIYFVLVAPVAFLSPLQVTRSYGNDVWRLTAIEVSFSGGMMVGGLVIAMWGGFSNKIHTMAVSLCSFGIFVSVLGFVPAFWLYLFSMVILGISMPLFNTPFTVLLQQKVDKNFLGRIFGVFTMISSSVMPLAMLVFGPLADKIAIEWMMLASGVALTVLGGAMAMDKRLVAAGKDDPSGQPEDQSLTL